MARQSSKSMPHHSNDFAIAGPKEQDPGLITSRDNKWVKLFRSVLQGSGSADRDLIGIEGPKFVEEAVQSGLDAEALIVSATGEREMGRILAASSESDTGIRRERIFRTSDKIFATLTGTETPQGVAALFRQPVWGFEDVLRGRPSRTGTLSGDAPLVVVLTGVQDPGNTGAILRSAEAFGATGAVTIRGNCDPWSPKALRASTGSALRLPLLRGISAAVLLAQLKMNQIKIVALIGRPSSAKPNSAPLHNANGENETAAILRGPAAIFVGNESAGLPGEVEHAADATISIPMTEAVESLNAAIAASVILYEAARQRKQS
jgi:TrmH family RNA methyltransferase